MLSPRKVKHRKVFTGKLRGVAHRGSSISFGDFALKATTSGKMTAQQIEAARVLAYRPKSKTLPILAAALRASMPSRPRFKFGGPETHRTVECPAAKTAM